MTRYGDAFFLPQETPEPRTRLQETLEGQQVARLRFLGADDVPAGWTGCAFMLTTSGIMVLMAAPVLDGPYLARLLWRKVEEQSIWTRTMERRFRRDRAPDDPVESDVQRRVEGEVIRGVLVEAAPNAHGGEQTRIEFVGGGILLIRAVPVGSKRADLDLEWTRPSERLVILPGEYGARREN